MNVSVIIPAYNAAETLAEALDSVRAQVCPTWEAIVVDDGSTDATATIAREFANRDPRIRVVSQANAGEAAARNTGISHARYDWLLFLDADDWISPRHLERMTAELRSDPQLDAVHCQSTRVAADGTLVAETYSPPTGDLFPILAKRAAFNVHACLVRKRIVQDVGGFDISIARLPDWDLWQRVARTGARFGAVHEVLAFYRMRPNSMSLDADQVLKDGLWVLRQGHSPDARVPNPHPDHVNGLPADGFRTEAFYFLSWCAGLVLGSGKDARPLIQMLEKEHYDKLYPPAIAECIFKAAPLATSQPPQVWERLWPEVGSLIESFLAALERQSLAPDLASRVIVELKRMVLRHSPSWAAVFEQMDHTVANQQAVIDQLGKDNQSFEAACEEQKRLSAELELLKTSLENELRQLRQRCDVLEQENTSLTTDAARWQRVFEQYERLLADFEKHPWVRLGRRVRTLRVPPHRRSLPKP